jgi:hypothetical protein
MLEVVERRKRRATRRAEGVRRRVCRNGCCDEDDLKRSMKMGMRLAYWVMQQHSGHEANCGCSAQHATCLSAAPSSDTYIYQAERSIPRYWRMRQEGRRRLLRTRRNERILEGTECIWQKPENKRSHELLKQMADLRGSKHCSWVLESLDAQDAGITPVRSTLC